MSTGKERLLGADIVKEVFMQLVEVKQELENSDRHRQLSRRSRYGGTTFILQKLRVHEQNLQPYHSLPQMRFISFLTSPEFILINTSHRYKLCHHILFNLHHSTLQILSSTAKSPCSDHVPLDVMHLVFYSWFLILRIETGSLQVLRIYPRTLHTMPHAFRYYYSNSLLVFSYKTILIPPATKYLFLSVFQAFSRSKQIFMLQALHHNLHPGNH